jgi:hypothetical protein
MSRTETFSCDSCGAQKGVTNHWWMVNRHTTAPEGGTTVMILPWLEKEAEDADEHYCGAACVQKRVALFLSENR